MQMPCRTCEHFTELKKQIAELQARLGGESLKTQVKAS
jgi:hypothetical protein